MFYLRNLHALIASWCRCSKVWFMRFQILRPSAHPLFFFLSAEISLYVVIYYFWILLHCTEPVTILKWKILKVGQHSICNNRIFAMLYLSYHSCFHLFYINLGFFPFSFRNCFLLEPKRPAALNILCTLLFKEACSLNLLIIASHSLINAIYLSSFNYKFMSLLTICLLW